MLEDRNSVSEDFDHLIDKIIDTYNSLTKHRENRRILSLLRLLVVMVHVMFLVNLAVLMVVLLMIVLFLLRMMRLVMVWMMIAVVLPMKIISRWELSAAPEPAQQQAQHLANLEPS